MSELKEVMNVMQVSGERIPSGYYKKCEVDAVLAEKDEEIYSIKYSRDEWAKACNQKDKEIAELKAQVHDYGQGLYVMQARAEKEARHHKYKRCLAMAWWCSAELGMLVSTWEFKIKHYKKWHIRWLELAEKFKEDV